MLVVLQASSCSKEDLSNQPSITNVTPSSGASGRRITIESNDAFVGGVSDQTVKFNRSLARVVSVTKSSMIVHVPDNAGSGTITVTSGGNTIQGPAFDYIDPFTTEYFVRFKQDGIPAEDITVSDVIPKLNCLASDAGPCHAIIYFASGHTIEAYFRINLDHDNTIASLEAMYGVSMPIRSRTMPPSVTFGLNVLEGNINSDEAPQIGTTASFKISKLSYHNSIAGDYDMYDAEGTFECVIYDKVQDVSSIITEGTFRIPIAAMAN